MKEKSMKKANTILGIILTVVGIILVLLNLLLLVPLSLNSESILYGGFIIISFLGAILCFTRPLKKSWIFITLAYPLLFIIMIALELLVFSPMFFSNSYKELLKDPINAEITTDFQAFDEKSAGIIPPTEAEAKMVSNMSQNGNIGSVMELGSITKQQVAGKVVYIAPLKYNGFFNWIKNKGAYDGYMVVDGTTGECNLVNANIAYSPYSYFGKDLSRVLYNNDKSKIYGDYTFELDDNNTAYFTATIYEKKYGFLPKKPIGIASVNCASGEVQTYDINNTPDYVDRIQPMDFVEDALNYKGKYINGFKLFDKKGKYKTTEGIGLVYMNDKCYYYTGITSLGADDASIGFYLVDSRTGESFLYNSNGVTEERAQEAATTINKSQQYSAAFPILTKVENDFVYFIPLLDSTDRVSEYAFVNAKDISIKGAGKTIADAENQYIKSLMSGDSLIATEGEEKTITGPILRAGQYNEDGNTYFTFMIEGSSSIFIGTHKISNIIPLLKEGDIVNITYLDNKRELLNINNIELKK